MKKKVFLPMGFLFVLIGIFFSITSCNEEMFENIQYHDEMGESYQNSIEMNVMKGVDWRGQLQKIIDTPPAILKESGIALLSYSIIDDIDSDVKALEMKKKLKSEEDMIPSYSKDLKSIQAITKTKARNISNDAQCYTFSICEKYIDDHIMVGMKVLSLRWNNKGVETTTSCIVSDKQGIVYDNFIINAFIINTPVTTIDVVAIDNKEEMGVNKLSAESETHDVMPIFSGFVNWSTSGTAEWLWGSERGYARILHTGHYYYDSFLRHDYSASHYFQLGNSDAEVQELAYNRIAYGYGFSTPGITINLTFNAGAFSLSFGGMIGSTAGDTGSHSHPLVYR